MSAKVWPTKERACPVCGEPLDVLAKAALSATCSACSWSGGIMYDDSGDCVITDLERIPDADSEAA